MAAKPSLIDKLLEDHQEVRQTFARFGTADRTKWGDIFSGLTNDLVRHEVVEEEIVFPEVRKELPNGDALADARTSEQSEAQELLSEMDKKGAGDKDFAANLARLRSAVLAHAAAEEKTVFAPLVYPERGAVGATRRALRQGQGHGATHPHPSAPDTPPGNMVLGPVAALADRFRDAMRKAS